MEQVFLLWNMYMQATEKVMCKKWIEVLGFFRLVLRCRQDARVRFAKMRSDVLVKIELLDQKHGKERYMYCILFSWYFSMYTSTFQSLYSCLFNFAKVIFMKSTMYM